MRFSLIIGTLHRSAKLEMCLTSFLEQKCKDFETIIIDQSDDLCTEELCKSQKYNTLKIKYRHVLYKGLSRARNEALTLAEGDYICLIDDDAIYPCDYILNINNILENKGEVILSGIILSIEDKKTGFIDYRNIVDGEIMDLNNILNVCPSAALVIPRRVFKKAGKFDEKMGVGNKFAAGEETDFLLRAIDNNFLIVHSLKIVVYHPIKPIEYDNLDSVYSHYMGKGALVKKDIIQRKTLRLIKFSVKNILGPIIRWCFSNKKNKQYYKIRLKGFIDGVLQFKF